MNIEQRYEFAKQAYQEIGVDTDLAIQTLAGIPISMHCWQGDDVSGFTNQDELSGGIQVTGNYPGKARSPKGLMQDIDKVLSMVAGVHKVNLHAIYAICKEGDKAEIDQLKPEHFEPWVAFAKQRGIGLDFNPTFFSHPKASDGLTLSHPDEEIRKFWIRHGKACLRISEYFATELGQPCVMNIWIPDGYKDVPADRLGPRRRFKESLDEILSIPYDKEKVYVSLESKVFGIGVEAYTVGSSEFCINYAREQGIFSLLDNGHYHPTELVSDKISSMLLFNEKVILHLTRPMRWDSDHVVLLDDETKEIAKEIVRNNALDKIVIALDFFDASINRIAAWTIGMRNTQKALLNALLLPNERLAELQNKGQFTELLMLQEELKMYPIGDVWNYFCHINQVPIKEAWYTEVKDYEKQVLMKRNNRNA